MGRWRDARRIGRGAKSSTLVPWRCRVGTPSGEVPGKAGRPWQPGYGLFRRWQRARAWAAIAISLQAVAVGLV